MPRDHRPAWNHWWIDAWEQQELAVPECDDRGMERLRPRQPVRRIGDDRRSLDDELDVVGKNLRCGNLERPSHAAPQLPQPRNFPYRGHAWSPGKLPACERSAKRE